MTISPKMTILNVEDYAMSREATSELLRQAGFEIVEAATGAEALCLVAAAPPDLVLLDAGLPDISGDEVCQRLKADLTTAAIPVLQISGSYSEQAGRGDELKRSADGYLLKPVEAEELIATIKALLFGQDSSESDSPVESSMLLKQKLSIPPATLSGLWVLVVEDGEDMRELMSLILEQYGARVTTAASAAEALGFFEQVATAPYNVTTARSYPDLLISDLGMPDEDGYSLIRRVRRLDPQCGGQIPAVALTGYNQVKDRIQALAAGFQRYVTKPIEPDELVMVVKSLVDRRCHAGSIAAGIHRELNVK